jgi:hypothetical protein
MLILDLLIFEFKRKNIVFRLGVLIGYEYDIIEV